MEIYQQITAAFSFFGLNTPIQRGIAFGALAGAAEFQIRPSYSYKSDGTPRPWAINNASPDATYLPAGSTVFLAAAAVSLFF